MVSDSEGRSRAYTVVRRDQVSKTQLPANAFDTGSPARLVLITCGGRFDRAVRSYVDNIVVDAVVTSA